MILQPCPHCGMIFEIEDHQQYATDVPDPEFCVPEYDQVSLSERGASSLKPDPEFEDVDEVWHAPQPTEFPTARAENVAAVAAGVFSAGGFCGAALLFEWATSLPALKAFETRPLIWQLMLLAPYVIVLAVGMMAIKKAFGERAASRGGWGVVGLIPLLVSGVSDVSLPVRIVFAAGGLYIVGSQIFDKTAAECRRVCLDRLGRKAFDRWSKSYAGRRAAMASPAAVALMPLVFNDYRLGLLVPSFLIGVVSLLMACFIKHLERTNLWQWMNRANA